ncbi:type IV toxin-antitoxin system AbiEi family antitoxin domain-containing protein [Iamia sp.]|uniref:type IV toxin-antitoxin system AbiEi family antitoxin domain-containing protein n=1 Tax=Iamia sp. TaxID=2722710 RepID=UPI002B616F1F|nr:type IV toxin-antitoxin system AbiEi family antitoxin domain-containing protein [Iamia sp.]HXH55919.1 type IV toxin-antitoxin system AbiEi family antitoxin domain-containing protein [Iamia sp.]
MDLFDLAARQHSAFSRDQARDLGLSDGQLRGLIQRRTVERAAPAVFRLRGVAPTWRQRLVIATLSIPGSMASHRAAARLWGLDGFATAPVEILVVRGRRRRRAPRGAVLHETMDLKGDDLAAREGIPCTALVRTLVDLPAVVHEFRSGVALDQAARHDHLLLAQVAERHREVARRGRDGTVALRALLAERGLGELVDSGFERRALRLIENSTLPRPVTQHHVVDSDFECWIDLAWPDLRVGMECDSLRHHTGERAFRWERKRRRRLNGLGWTMLEFTYLEVTRESPMVIRDLSQHLLR